MLPLSPRTSTHVFKCSWFYVTECAVEHGLGSNLKNTMKNLKRTFWGKWFWLCRWMIRWKWTVTVAVANVKTGQFWNNFLDDFEIIDSHFATLPRSFEKKRVFMNTVSGPPGCFCRCALRSLKRPKHHLLVISHIKSKWKVWNMFSTNGRFFWNNCCRKKYSCEIRRLVGCLSRDKPWRSVTNRDKPWRTVTQTKNST